MAAQTEPIRMKHGRVAVVDIVVRNRADNEHALKMVASLMNRPRTKDEEDLLRVLTTAIQAYESRAYADLSANVEPADLVRFLLEQNGQSPKDLAKLFGGKSHVSEVLSGQRKIGPKYAIRLAKHFNLNPVLFLQLG